MCGKFNHYSHDPGGAPFLLDWSELSTMPLLSLYLLSLEKWNQHQQTKRFASLDCILMSAWCAKAHDPESINKGYWLNYSGGLMVMMCVD